MTYPPQDPYGQQPGSQPPPGGYAPGQVGPDYGAQPPQYTQPEMGQPGYPPQQGYGSQPGYPQQGFPDPYGQFSGPPPIPPVTSKGSSGTAVLIVVVLILMIGGGVAGYLLLGGDDEPATTTAGEDATSESTEAPSEEPDEEEPTDEGDGGAEEPVGDALIVESLGAVTPLPGDPWEYYGGPGDSGNLSEDTNSYFIPHTDVWISYMEVGLASSLYAPYDPADLEGSAAAALEVWTSGFAFGSTEGVEVGATEFTDVEVDGHPGVLAEARVTWTASDSTEDLYEDTAVLLVDVDGTNGFIALVSVPESGTDSRQAAIDAVLATTFGAEQA